jgi:hypothetical protein
MQLVEAYGPMLALAIAAPFRLRLARALSSWLLLDVAVVVAFVVRKRFFLTAAAGVLPLCAAGLARMPVLLRNVTLAVLCGIGMWYAWTHVTDPNRIAEREVGEHIAEILGPQEEVVGDLQRVIWFAGRRPPPPRHYSATELLEQARQPAVTFVVLASGHREFEAVKEGLGDAFATYSLPAQPVNIAAHARARGIEVFVRK